MRILIVEDEPLAAKRLKKMLAELAPEGEVLAELDSVKQSVAWLKAHQADLIFLDIHLADGNSFSIFESVEVQTPIIFVTAYDQYAIRAFRLNSVDYLLKPIEKEELAQSLEKFRRQRQARIPIDVNALVASLKPETPQYQKRFMVSSGDKIRSILIEEVAYFYGKQKYVFLVTQDNRRHLIDFTLTQLEELLDPGEFFRINRQFIVSFPAINQMFSWTKGRVKLELKPEAEEDAIVSIEKSRSFKDWLNR